MIDVERYADNDREEMARVGRGLIYSHDHRERLFRRAPAPAERADLLARDYELYWRDLRAAAAGSVLVELHSYPADPWRIERHAVGLRPEIDIGFSAGLTPPAWVEVLTQLFQSFGYSVRHNTLYSGVIDAGARAAVMIEVRRDVVGEPGASQAWSRLVETQAGAPLPEAQA